MSTIKKRSEVDKKFTWAIEDIFATDEEWQKAYDEVSAQIDKIAEFKGKVIDSAKNLLDYFNLSSELDQKISAISTYASRKADEDTGNPKYQKLEGMTQAIYVKYSSSTAFAIPEIMELTEEMLSKYYEDCSELKIYDLKIKRLLAKKAHVLSEAEEKIIALTKEMQNAPESIFSMFNNADAKYPDVTDSDGKTISVTHGNYIRLLSSKDRKLRKEAYNSMYSIYKRNKNTLAAILDAQIKQLSFNSKARKYKDNLDAALSSTEVPRDVYYNLIDTVHSNMHYMYKYMALRKKLLKLDELCMYDIFTPIVPKSQTDIPFEAAKQTVYDALEPLGEEYRSILKEGFDNRWIDVYENEGKRSGAYSAGSRPHPFVLLNYNDTLDSEFTLAHEMGHAIHSYLSTKTQHPAYANYKIFVAEVASTCNEALLMRYLLKKTEDKKEKAILINHFLDEFRTTLYRQTMFAEFELEINKLVESGEKLTANTLNKIYHDLNVLYYGPDMVVDENIDIEWARIPHFYYDYYVYQYATGYSAAIALSDKILKEGKTAVDNYIKFLSSGASSDPISLLKIAGVDMGTPEPINHALAVFGELIDEFEVLVNEL